MKRLSKSVRWTAAGLLAAVAVVAASSLILGPFGSYSVCDRCGALRRTTAWQIPHSSVTLFTRSTDSDSALSRVLLANGIVEPHEHRWRFGHGSGNGILCAIGPGRHIRSAAGSDELADLVLHLHTDGETALRDRLVQQALDPATSRSVWAWVLSAPTPLTSTSDLRRGIAEISEFLEYIEEMAAAYMGP